MKGGAKMEGKKIPTGVKVISILYYITAILAIIFGLLFLFGGGAIANLIPGLGILGGGLFIVIGIIFIGLGILGFFIGRGLWKAKKWARILVIVFAGLGIISAITQMVQGDFMSSIINLAINGIIGGYLIISKKVKKTFA